MSLRVSSASQWSFFSTGALVRRRRVSSSASRPSDWYCSNWLADMNRFEPTVSKEPVPESAGSSLTLISTPSISRRVFLYSRRLSRRMVMTPFWSPRFRRATTIRLERSSRKSVFPALGGCFSSSGGISPAFIWLRIFCQRSAVSSEVISSGRSSMRNLPFCFSGPWQLLQWESRRAR